MSPNSIRSARIKSDVNQTISRHLAVAVSFISASKVIGLTSLTTRTVLPGNICRGAAEREFVCIVY
jgi:hypothetical protein